MKSAEPDQSAHQPQDASCETLPADPSALLTVARERLGRRMLLAVLAPRDATASALRGLADALAALPGVRVIYEQPSQLEDVLTRLHSLGPDVVLVGGGDEEAAPGTDSWHARVFAVAERVGLCDRSFVALVGAWVTRQSARRAGFEDGFPLATPLEALVPALVREALARDELRRQGSSPPCYLR